MENLKTNRLNYLEDFFGILAQNIIYCRITSDDIIVEASDMFCKITQYTKEELQGRYYSSLMVHKTNLYSGEIEYKKKNHELFWLDIKKVPQYDENNKFLCFIIIHQDITASKQVKSLNESLKLSILETANESMKVHHLNITLEKRIQEAVEEAKKKEHQLIEQSKLAIMGEMIAMIAHQWKQPLNVLSLNIANLEVINMMQEYDAYELESILDHSNNTIDYMIKTISDFSEFLKPDNQSNLINIDSIFFQVETLIQNELKKYNINFNIHFLINKNEKLKISISKFTQVMINILKNSIDAFKEKHIINPSINIIVSSDSDKFIIEIKDNAGGIPANILKTIFDPYISTKGKNGTGLGMYMSKLIVEGHLNGKITATNTTHGAAFEIVIKTNN